jgi:uncharacterized delta-60 repeat protein
MTIGYKYFIRKQKAVRRLTFSKDEVGNTANGFAPNFAQQRQTAANGRRLFLAFAVLLFNMVCKAQFRDGLDLTFGKDGFVAKSLPPSPSSDDRIFDAILQADGKIVAIASNRVVRFLANGNFDSSFGTFGVCVDTFFNPDKSIDLYYSANKLGFQHDNSIMLTGISNLSKDPMVRIPRVFVTRIDSNGRIDRTFGVNGTFTDSSLIRINVSDLKILKDDKIVLSADSSYSACLIQIKKDGFFDSSFGVNGKVLDYSSLGTGPRIAIDKDGKILQVRNKFKVARYLPNGVLDSTFNNTGKTLINPISFSAGYSNTSSNIKIAIDGKIWIAGNTSSYDIIEPFTLGRFTSDGILDSTFNAVGYAQYPWDTSRLNLFSDMLIDHSGKVILAGTVINKISKKDNFGLMRILPDGSLDPDFGKGGKLMTQLYGYSVRQDRLYCILEQADHKILAFGTTSDTIITTYATIARYNGNGKNSIRKQLKSRENLFVIYPNPSNGKMLINTPKSEGVINVTIFDLLGRVMQKQKLSIHKNEATLTLNLPFAIYILELKDDSGNIQRERIVVE